MLQYVHLNWYNYQINPQEGIHWQEKKEPKLLFQSHNTYKTFYMYKEYTLAFQNDHFLSSRALFLLYGP